MPGVDILVISFRPVRCCRHNESLSVLSGTMPSPAWSVAMQTSERKASHGHLPMTSPSIDRLGSTVCVLD